MTNDQAQRLRVLLQEAFDMVLGRPIAFVLVAQDEQRNLEIVSNAQNREGLAPLLAEAAKIVTTPPDGTIAIPDHRDAAAQAPTPSECATPSAQPAAAAFSAQCAVKEGEQQCGAPAVGGLRVNLHATPAIQKRYGKRVMLSLIFDLPVCMGCMSKITPDNLMTGDQWRAFSKAAQQRNSGVLADRSQTEIVLCPFDAPDYVLLREQIAKQRAANESQPAPAGPQQGA